MKRSQKRQTGLICIASAGLLFNAYSQDINIVRNPGFENGLDSWFDRTCSIEHVTSPVHAGRGSARAFNRLANWQGIKQSVLERMIDGETYQVSGWVRLENAASDEAAISFEQQDDTGTQYMGVVRAEVSDTAWVQLSGEFTLNVTGTLSVLDVYFEGPEPGVHFFVDDVVVRGPAADVPEVIPPEPEGKARIDVAIRHQMIEGFGGSGAYYTEHFTRHHAKSDLCHLIFSGLGLDIFRIRNNYRMEPESFEQSVEIAKCGEASLGRDLKIMISSWSPPADLKNNGNTIGGTLKQDNGKFVYDAFAEWWYRSLVAYEEAGLDIDYISIQNELDYEAPWNSCQFAPSDDPETGLAAYDTAFETVWQRLYDETGSGMPKMLAPESSGLGNGQTYIREINDLSHVYGYAHHLYDCSGCGRAPDRFIPRMISLNQFVKDSVQKPVFQTEFEEDPGTWEDALNTALTIHNSLTVEEVSAYLYWDLFWVPGSGLISLDDSCTYTITPTYYAFKNYSAFIHSGWQRVETSTDNSGLRISACISPDEQELTAVILNISEETDISLDLSVPNLEIHQGRIYRSSQTEHCVQAGVFNGKAPLKLPANSVTTLCMTLQK